MTIVCAITDGEATWIGSDRQYQVGPNAVQAIAGKWVELPSGWWVGVSGAVRLVDMLPLCSHTSYDARGLAAAFSRLVREDGWKPYGDDGSPAEYDCACLLARPGELWSLHAMSALLEAPPGGLVAIGSGSPYAYGSAYTSHALQEHVAPGGRVRIACASACKHDPGCGMGVWTKELR